MSEQAGFDPLGALRSLVDGGVRFVLIGGVASRLHGSPSLTRDVDICHERDTANLERLVAVLQSVGARLRGVDEDLPFVLDAKTLGAGSNFTFTTEFGDVDAGIEGGGTRRGPQGGRDSRGDSRRGRAGQLTPATRWWDRRSPGPASP